MPGRSPMMPAGRAIFPNPGKVLRNSRYTGSLPRLPREPSEANDARWRAEVVQLIDGFEVRIVSLEEQLRKALARIKTLEGGRP